MKLKSSFSYVMVSAVLFISFLFWWTSAGVLKTNVIEEHVFVCETVKIDLRVNLDNKEYKPIIYFVTPTYPRREQAAELTRLGQTLMHISHLHWIVADDNYSCSPVLEKLIKKFGIPFTYIASPMPDHYRSEQVVPRGVANRKAALNWIRANIKGGVLYFGDDDNTFDLRLFSEIRYTKKISMFPVGLIGDYAISAPIVQEGKVIGFFDSWPAGRLWPVDMAGFAINLKYLKENPNATMPYKAGYEEDLFLRSLGLKIDDIEPKAKDCTEILVWHTQTTKTPSPVIQITQKSRQLYRSLDLLLKELDDLGLAHTSEISGVKSGIIKDGKLMPL